jgi:CRISPR/Cas system-associated protein Cas5 (RAMP superfamily)
VECIEITEHYCFSVGNAIKYLWRAGLKEDADKTSSEKEIQDCEKAVWYIKRHIEKLQKEQK